MLERQVVIPASPDELWVALTDPGEVVQWFGSEVDWELRPGGRARFTEADGSIREGQVESVSPGRRLSFRWWREDGDSSRVTYTLEPEEEGTRLIVSEQPLTLPPGTGTRTGAGTDSSTDSGGSRGSRGSEGGAASPATASARPADSARDGAMVPTAAGVGHFVGAGLLPGSESWTRWDTQLFQCWARAGAVAVARGSRR